MERYSSRGSLLALVINFILVPALASLLAKTILATQQGLSTGMILLGTAAGAPFLSKLTHVARSACRSL